MGSLLPPLVRNSLDSWFFVSKVYRKECRMDRLEERSAAVLKLREVQETLARLGRSAMQSPSIHTGTTVDQPHPNDLHLSQRTVSQVVVASPRQAAGTLNSDEATIHKSKPSTLTMISVFFEKDPHLRFSFPFRAEPLWSLLSEKARKTGPHHSPEKLYQQVRSGQPEVVIPWVVVSSIHETTPRVVHAEDLRSIMLELSLQNPHCVIDGSGHTVGSAMFWSDWQYRALLEQRAVAKLNFEDQSNALRGGQPRPPAFFPGELIRPLSHTSLMVNKN